MKLSDFEEKVLSKWNYYPDDIEEGVTFLPYDNKKAVWKKHEKERVFWNSNIIDTNPTNRIMYYGVFKHPKYGEGIFVNNNYHNEFLFENENEVKLSINRFYKIKKFADDLIESGYLEIRMCTVNMSPIILTDSET